MGSASFDSGVVPWVSTALLAQKLLYYAPFCMPEFTIKGERARLGIMQCSMLLYLVLCEFCLYVCWKDKECIP